MRISSIIKKECKHAFSVELKSKEYVKRVAIPNEVEDNVLFEGFLGKLDELAIIEGVMLQIKGANGILRIELKEEELKKLVTKGGKRL
jgi:hypothetical protein